jgi:hypothetical protein
VNPLEFVFKLLWNAWPFVKEMVLDGRSLKHAFQFNRRRAIFSVVVMASFAFNMLNFGIDGRMVSVMMKYVKLEKDHVAMGKELDRLKTSMVTNNCPLPAPAEPASAPAPEVITVPDTAGQQNRYDALQSTFTNLNRQ